MWDTADPNVLVVGDGTALHAFLYMPVRCGPSPPHGPARPRTCAPHRASLQPTPLSTADLGGTPGRALALCVPHAPSRLCPVSRIQCLPIRIVS
jgi:hypothetical protein